MEFSSPIQFLDATRTNGSIAPLVCYAPTMTSMSGIWHGERPLDYSLPLFFFQLMLTIFSSRLSAFILGSLRQPRYISDIIGGFILGPTVMGQIPMFSIIMFPLRSLLILESVANLGLIYFMFILGIQLQFDFISRSGIKSVLLATASLAGPLAIGMTSALSLKGSSDPHVDHGAFITFLGVSFSVTGFSLLAGLLAHFKLLTSEIGCLSISAALINNTVAWILLSLSIALAQSRGDVLGSLWTVISGIVFLVVCFALVRPVSLWVMRRTPEGEEVDELYSCSLLVGVLVSAFIAEAIGTHAIFGAFIFGLAVPGGMLGESMIDKVEDFVKGLLLPVFYVISGLRADLRSIRDGVEAVKLVVVVLAAGASKVGGSLLAAYFYQMPMQDGLEMGLLMNSKGIVELIILNIGRDKHIVNTQTFTILLIMSVFITSLVPPLLDAVVRSSRRFVVYKRRTVRWSNPESELRVLVGIHHPRNVPALITLLDIAHPTKRSPIFVYALHLVELTGRTATLLVNSSTNKDLTNAGGGGHIHKVQTQSEQVAHAFETYEQHAGGVSVQALTALSPYLTMHDDVVGVAEDKHVALILLPFHKHQTVDGFMEVTHPDIRSLNQNALSSAPCSFGILIDRGLGTTGPRTPGRGTHIGLLFFGGADDREVLAFASRMAGHPNIALTLYRFIPGLTNNSSYSSQSSQCPSPDQNAIHMNMRSGLSNDRERHLDEACLEEFRARWEGGNIQYVDKVSRNAEETIAGLREMVDGVHDLYIVGRAHRVDSPLTAGLTEWSECPELGAIGDLLSTSDFAAGVSVLVVQQGKLHDGVVTGLPDSPGRHVKVFVPGHRV